MAHRTAHSYLKRTQKERDEDAETLQNAIQDALEEAELPDLKAIVCSFFQQLGGHQKFAAMLVKEFRAAPTGSMIRARIIETMLQASKVITSKEAARDIERLTDDDIDRELTALISNVPSASRYQTRKERAQQRADRIAERGRALGRAKDAAQGPEPGPGGASPETTGVHAGGPGSGIEGAAAGEAKAQDRGAETVCSDAEAESVPRLESEGAPAAGSEPGRQDAGDVR